MVIVWLTYSLLRNISTPDGADTHHLGQGTPPNPEAMVVAEGEAGLDDMSI